MILIHFNLFVLRLVHLDQFEMRLIYFDSESFLHHMEPFKGNLTQEIKLGGQQATQPRRAIMPPWLAWQHMTMKSDCKPQQPQCLQHTIAQPAKKIACRAAVLP